MDIKSIESDRSTKNDHNLLQYYLDKNKFSELGAEVIQHIFSSCNVDNDDRVEVSKLLEFIAPYTADFSIELSTLKNALDPKGVNPTVNQEIFSNAFTEWILELNQLTKHFETLEVSSNNASSLSTPDGPLQEMHCPKDKVNQLKFQNRQLKEQLDVLQEQLNASENENEFLICKNTEFKNKLFELQIINNNLTVNESDIDTVQEDSTKLKSVIKSLQKSSALQIKEIEELNQNLEEKNDKNKQLENDAEHLNTKITETNKNISELEQEMLEKENNMSDFTEMKNVLDNKIKELEDLLGHYKEENQHLRSEKQKLEKLEQCCQDNAVQLMSLNKTENHKNCKIISRRSSETSLHNNLYKNITWRVAITHSSTYKSLQQEISQANKELLLNKYHSIINKQKLMIEQLVEKAQINIASTKDEASPHPTSTDLSLLELKIIDLEADSNKKYIRIVDLMEQKEQLQKQLDADREKYMQEKHCLTEENKKLVSENSKNQLDLKEIYNQKCALGSENQKFESAANKCSELENMLNKISEDHKTLTEEYKQLESKNLKLEKQLNFLSSAYKECHKEKVELKDIIKKLEKECTIKYIEGTEQSVKSIALQVDADLEEITTNGIIKYRLSDKSERLLKKEKQIKILQKMVDYQNLELQVLSTDKKRHLDQIYNLKSNYDKLSKLAEELKIQLYDSKNANENLSSEVEFLNKLNESLQVDLQHANNEYTNFQAGFCPIENYNTLDNENKLVKTERDRLADENEVYKAKVSNLEDQILSLLEKVNTLSSNITEIKTHLQNYKLVIKKLRNKLNNQKRKTYNKLEDEYIKKINHLEDKNLLLQNQQRDLWLEVNSEKTTYTMIIKEKEKWILEKRELNEIKEKLLRELDQTLTEKRQIEIQLAKKSQMVCEHCSKLHKEKEELHKNIKDLQYEIGLLEKEIYAPKKGNYEMAQIQLDKLKKNLEVTNDLLQHEKHNNEMFKLQNTHLLSEIGDIKTQTFQEKRVLENRYIDAITNLKKKVEELQIAQISLKNCNSTAEQELEAAHTKNKDLQSKAAELFSENLSLEEKLDEVLQELRNKTNTSAKLQEELHNEKMLLELFHQKSVLFQQNIDSMYNQKNVLEKKLHKALNDLQKSENKYMSIRKLLVDTQSHVSGDFENILQIEESQEKVLNLECTLKNCQEELSIIKLKYAESVKNVNSLKETIHVGGATVKKNRKRLHNSIRNLASSWHGMLEKVIDVQLLLNSLPTDEEDDADNLDDEIVKLENDIHLTLLLLNALDTFKSTMKQDGDHEPVLLQNSKFVKKVTFTSTVTRIQQVDSREELIKGNSSGNEEITNTDATKQEEEVS